MKTISNIAVKVAICVTLLVLAFVFGGVVIYLVHCYNAGALIDIREFVAPFRGFAFWFAISGVVALSLTGIVVGVDILMEE